MQKTEKIRNLNRTYIRTEDMSDITEYKEKILLKNKIQGLVHIDKRYIDDIPCYYYEITSMRSLTEKMEKENIKADFIRKIFTALQETCRNLEDYLLEAGDICLKPEYIYEDMETGRIGFFCIPDYTGRQKEDMALLTEFIIAHMDNGRPEQTDTLYTFYNEQLLYGDNLTAMELCRLWNQYGIKEEQVPEPPMSVQEETAPYIFENRKNTDCPEETGRKFWQRKIYKVPYNGGEVD